MRLLIALILTIMPWKLQADSEKISTQQALTLGVVQGLTEFLPVSSSGHIVLFGSLFELDNLLLISVVAHIGTLFAVLFCYRKKLIELVKHPKNPTNLKLIIAIPCKV